MTCKVEIDGVEIPSEKEGKCPGYWWQGDLLAKKAVEENVSLCMEHWGPFKET